MSFDLAHLRCMTLSQAESAWQAGDVSDADLDAFLAEWNATPGRLAHFEPRDGRLRQVWEREGEMPLWADYRADPCARDTP